MRLVLNTIHREMKMANFFWGGEGVNEISLTYKMYCLMYRKEKNEK